MFTRAASWGVLLSVWLAIGGLLTLELYLSLSAADPAVSLGSVAVGQFMRVLFWAALTPPVFWLQRVFPISRGTWYWAIPLHGALSVAAMAVIYLGRLGVAFVYFGESAAGFWDRALSEFYGRNLVDIAIYWAVCGAGYTMEVMRQYRETQLRSARLEKDLAQAEMKALKAQLHPHFLFNTLNTIAVLVRDGQNTEAVSLIAKLSALLRMTLESTGQQEITLRQELDFLERYLAIQHARFSDRLNVRFDVDPGALEAMMPNLLLQPLVENAVIHGFSRKTGAGSIEVVARREIDRLQLAVRDDGPGFPANRAAMREGIGLANTRNRLARLFGADARFECANRPEGGAEVTISIPFRSRAAMTAPVAAGALA